MELERFGMNTVTLSGALDSKLAAVRAAGLGCVELWAKDLVGHPDGVEAAIRDVRSSGLSIASFQLLRDYEGLSGHLLDYKLEIAKSLMELMDRVGARTLLVVSSTSPDASGDPHKIAEDLKRLATLATPRGIRIAYEAVSWGRFINEYTHAWEVVRLADRENVGLVIDAFQILRRGTALAHLAAIPGHRIFLVQLSDYLYEVSDAIETGRHARVFPAEGNHTRALAELCTRVEDTGYAGDWTFEVFNDEYAAAPPASVAERAHRAALWTLEQRRGGKPAQP